MSVGFPASIKLYTVFGSFLSAAFDVTCAYHVGSSLMKKGWRDVDVVVLLEDDDFEKQFGSRTPEGAKWEAFCAAFSALGHDLTGLPIDFKVQPREWANEKFPHDKEHPDENLRSAMLGAISLVRTVTAGKETAEPFRDGWELWRCEHCGWEVTKVPVDPLHSDCLNMLLTCRGPFVRVKDRRRALLSGEPGKETT